MRIDVASEEVRTAVKGLCFNFEDLVPVPDKKLRWRVPMQKLKEKPELGNLMSLYFKQEHPQIAKRIEAEGRKIIELRGPDVLYIGDDFAVDPDEILIYMRCPNPQRPPIAPMASVEGDDPSPSSSAPPGDHTCDSASCPDLLTSPEHPPEHPADSSHDGNHRGAGGIETESQGDACILPRMSSAHQSDQPNEDILLQLMGHRLEIVVKHRHNDQSLMESLSLGMGDKLELHEFEDLKVTAGVFAALTMGIKVVRSQ